MSTHLKKKIKKKKKKNHNDKDEEIVPMKHERTGNINYYSEEIAKNIFEKIFSLIFTNNFHNKIENKISDYCFDLTKKAVNNLIELNNINHDCDDFDIDKIEINSCIKYNNSDTNIKRYKVKIHKIALGIRNDKVEENLMESLDMPRPFKNKKIDESLNKSTLTEKNKYLSKGKLYQYSINLTKNNFWGDIPCPKVNNIDRTSSNYNNFIPKKEESKKDLKHNKKKSVSLNQEKTNFSYSNFISRLSKNVNSLRDKNKSNNIIDAFIPKKRPFVSLYNYPSYPLENIELKKEETEEIINLRKEAIELANIKEKNKRRKYVYQPEKTKEDIEKEKMIKKGKFTYDNEGKVLIVKEFRQESLPKEFSAIMSRQKEIKPAKTFEACKKEKALMESKAEKNIEYNNDEEQIINSYLVKSRLTQPLLNLAGLSDYMKNFYTDNEIDKNTLQRKNNDFLLLSKINTKSRVEPSGSNFNLINPSVGVTIKDKKNEKSGGNNFYREFHKYSVNDFNRTLQDTLEWSKMKFKEKSKEEFNPTVTAELPNLKDSNFFKKMVIKEDKDKDGSELNDINVKTDFMQKIKNKRTSQRFLEEQTKKTNIENSSIFTNTKYYTKKNMVKSSSEININTDKLNKFKELLFHDNDFRTTYIKPYKNTLSDKNNSIFEFRNQSSIKTKNKNKQNSTKKYNEMDTFNKNIILGNTIYQRTLNKNMVLPKISMKNNETNYSNRTMINFIRERSKKSVWKDYMEKRENDSKKKKVKKVKSIRKQFF